MWVESDKRDNLVDYVNTWSEKTEIAKYQIIKWVGIGKSKFYNWCERYGKVNEHNALVPRDRWLLDEEK